MSGFGFISPDLQPCLWWNRWNGWLPDKWRYLRGPLTAGELIGAYGSLERRGWGWKAPAQPGQLWKSGLTSLIWRRLSRECLAREIDVVGLSRMSAVVPPPDLARPQLSDGNSLELVLFMRRFQSRFPRAFLATPDCEVAIVWEEGNLGLICARWLGTEIRFLTLIHPRRRVLEDAATQLMAETGLAAKIRLDLPEKWSNIKIVIQCGRFSYYSSLRLKGQIHYRLFQGLDLPENGDGLPLRVRGRFAPVSLNTVVGEAFLRSLTETDGEHWYGSTMKLERAVQIQTMLEKLEFGQLEVNGSA